MCKLAIYLKSITSILVKILRYFVSVRINFFLMFLILKPLVMSNVLNIYLCASF